MPATLQSSDDTLNLTVRETLRDNEWVCDLGVWAAEFNRSNLREICIDISRATWVDPGPLLSIALLLEQARFSERLIKINLGNTADKRLSSRSREERAAFQNFLEREGFLSSFLGSAQRERATLPADTTVTMGAKKVDTYDEIQRHVLKHNPILPSAVSCIKSKILNLDKVDFVPELVDKIVVEAENNGLKKHFEGRGYSSARRISTLQLDELNPKYFSEELRQILIEVIDNVKEHAYAAASEKVEPSLCAVYGRLRYGLSDSRAKHIRPTLTQEFENEFKYCKHLGTTTTLVQTGFLELFVADLGIGLTSHLRARLNKEGKSGRHAMKTFIHRMIDGRELSRFGGPEERLALNKSPDPGLCHLERLLRRGSGFFRFLANDEWAGAVCPLEQPATTEIENPELQTSFSFNGPPVPGTQILIRVSTGRVRALDNRWKPVFYRPSRAPRDRSSPLTAWTATSHEHWSPIEFEVYDDDLGRNRTSRPMPYRITIGNSSASKPGQYLLWRPSRSLRRNDILKRIFELLRSTAARGIFVVDQDQATAMTTRLVLDGIKRSPALSVQKAIWIISSNLAVSKLVASRIEGGIRTAIRSKLPRQGPLFPSRISQPEKGLSLSHVIRALRILDGENFWSAAARKNQQTKLIIRGPIEWRKSGSDGERLSLDSYLDFSAAINYKQCRRACRRALGRFLSFLSPSEAPHPTDHLVDSIVNGFVYQANYELAEADSDSRKQAAMLNHSRPRVNLGSLLVSQTKEVRFRGRSTEIGESSLLAYFFRHPASIHEDTSFHPVSLIPWFSESGVQELVSIKNLPSNPNLSRVTDTPILADGGAKYWRLLRADEKGALYGRSPGNLKGVSTSEAYSYWQSRNLLRLGHWHQGSRHDFVAIDLLSALRVDRLSQRGLVWTFLKSHLRRIAKGYSDPGGFPPCDLLASVASEATSLILNSLSDEIPELQEKSILLPLAQRQRSAMQLRVSPTSIESLETRIKDLKRQKSTVTVLLLAVSYSSIRTFSEMVTCLKDAGADRVYSIGLLDRTRVPNHALPFRKDWHLRHARLWRLDVDDLAPSLGEMPAAGCPLCQAISKIESIIKDLPAGSHSVRDRLNYWIQIAKVRALSTAAPLAGLHPLELAKSVIVSFTRSLDPAADEERVEVSEVSALATALVEAVTITGSHESVRRVLKLASDISKDHEGSLLKPSEVQIYALVAQAIVMRYDTDLGRRRVTFLRLARALASTDRSSNATAFAGLILSSADTMIAPDLQEKIKEDLLDDYSPESEEITNDLFDAKNRGNLDFTLASAILLKDATQERTSELGSGLRAKGLSCLIKPSSSFFPYQLRDLFLIIGYRDGNYHKTKLKRLLWQRSEPSARRRGPLGAIVALAEKVMLGLKQIQSSVEWHPEYRPVDTKKIKRWQDAIQAAVDALSQYAAELNLDGFEDARKAITRLKSLFYDSEGCIYVDLRDMFSVNPGQLPHVVETIFQDLISEIDLDKDYSFALQRYARSNPGEEIDRIRALMVQPIEDLIREIFANAIEYSTVAYPSRHDGVRGPRVYWTARSSHSDMSIELFIWNRCSLKEFEIKKSVKNEYLERIGGSVEYNIEKDMHWKQRTLGQSIKEFGVKISLPSLNALAHL